MDLVIDTNRIMAGLLKDSGSRKIVLHGSFSFYAPDYIETELLKHRSYLVKKAKISETDFDILIHTLLDKVILVPFDDFQHEYDHAMQVMETIDENDSPFLAVGLALGIPGIWTEDRHFSRQRLLKVYSTRDLIKQIQRQKTVLPHHLRERENDLIGNYFEHYRKAPEYQFKNNRQRILVDLASGDAHAAGAMPPGASDPPPSFRAWQDAVATKRLLKRENP